jgi:outer membrane immunogenic protein
MKTTLLGAAAFSLVTASAFGADLGVPLKAPMAAPFTWTGCYAGVQVGGGLGQKDLTDTVGTVSAVTGFTSANLDVSGYMLGGQIGCDYQFSSNWVVGIEGAASGGNIGGSTTVLVPGDNATFAETTDLLTSATARLGYAWNRWMLYAKGGAAWAGDRYNTSDALAIYNFQGLETRFGWTAGAGIEWALWDSWSLKFEYDYYGFGTQSVTFIDAVSGTTGPLNINQTVQIVKLGLNFRIGGDLGWSP